MINATYFTAVCRWGCSGLTLRSGSGSLRATQRFRRRLLQLSQLSTSDVGARQSTFRASQRTYTQTHIKHLDYTANYAEEWFVTF